MLKLIMNLSMSVAVSKHIITIIDKGGRGIIVSEFFFASWLMRQDIVCVDHSRVVF